MAAICDLPVEMRLEILEKLSLDELVVNPSKTCHQWRDDIAQHILASKILALAEVNEKFKMDIKEKGWAEEANNPTELLMSLYPTLFIYNKYEHFTSKFFFLLDCHYLLCSTMDFCSFRNQGAGLIWNTNWSIRIPSGHHRSCRPQVRQDIQHGSFG